MVAARDDQKPSNPLALLRRYRRQLARLGLQVDQSAYSEVWLGRLHNILNRENDGVPIPLQAALIDIADLATELGHELIVAQSLERGVDLFADGKTIARQDLAFAVYLDRPDLFRAAHARLQGLDAPTFAEFYGKRSAHSPNQALEPEIAVLRHRLSQAFQARNRTRSCRILVERLGSQLVFTFVHGAAPHATVSVDADQNRQRRTYVPECCEVVLYDKLTDRLSVSAPFPADQELYREVMGLVLALDEQYFRTWPAFRGDPLKERGSAALKIRGVLGLVRVTLPKLTLLARDLKESRLEFVADDLSEELDRPPLSGILQLRSIGAWTFGVVVPQNPSPLGVDILPPNHFRFDRRLPLQPFREFLLAQGFLHVPP